MNKKTLEAKKSVEAELELINGFKFSLGIESQNHYLAVRYNAITAKQAAQNITTESKVY